MEKAEILKNLKTWIKKSEKLIEESQMNLRSCVAQGMSDGAINNIQLGIQRETGRLNGYKDAYILVSRS